MVSFVRLGPRSTPKEMALTSQLSQAVKVAAIEKINDVVDFVDLIVECLSQQNYEKVLLSFGVDRQLKPSVHAG
jgi:hypothetical protein